MSLLTAGLTGYLAGDKAKRRNYEPWSAANSAANLVATASVVDPAIIS